MQMEYHRTATVSSITANYTRYLEDGTTAHSGKHQLLEIHS